MRLSPGIMTFLIGLIILLVAGVVYQRVAAPPPAAPGGGSATAPAPAVKYACPMRCVELDHPGDCPVCGMEMMPIETVSITSTAGHDHAEPELYTCPMHPQVEQDHPGTCPICGMELVPAADDSAAVDSETAELVSAVKLSPLQSLLAAVEPVHAAYEEVAESVAVLGEVESPADREHVLTSWQDGRIDNLYVRETGVQIREGQHILDIYSEELVQAQDEYLLALDAEQRLGGSEYESVRATTSSLVTAAESRLRRLGLSAEQIERLAADRVVEEHIAIHATAGGLVVEQFVAEGNYVREGAPLFRVADFSTVWVSLKVFESEMSYFRPGMQVTLDCPVHAGMQFPATVELVEPSLDPATRTYQVRVAVHNTGLTLRPGMIIEGNLQVSHGELLLLPRNAVLHTGDSALVYVQAGVDQWEPRRVETGLDLGEQVEITSGLSPDEAVAGTAVFLLDSEAQLKGVPRPEPQAHADAEATDGH